ncbi:MAG: BLUF domain-containing protein [Pseudomonadota bacterium]
MHRLVYISTAKWLFDARELEDLLINAKRNNLRDNVTGMLIYHDGCFFQVLEGPEKAVRDCFQRISKDLRHSGTIVLLDEPAASRQFGGWQMACRTFSGLTSLQKRQFIDLNMLADAVSKGLTMQDAPKTKAVLLAFLSAFRDLDVQAA